MSFVEIHFHLLPGVDDGPSSIDESVTLAAAAVCDGTRLVVSTPHVHPDRVTDPYEISARTRELLEDLRRARIPLSVLPGGELAHTMVERLGDRELDQIAQGSPGKRWLLLEAPFGGLDDHFQVAADELRERGFAVVVAHPERVRWTGGTEAALAHERSRGSVLQLTAGSFTGAYGEDVRDTALGLLRASHGAAIASDAHGGTRLPMLRQALAALASAGEADPARFVARNPWMLIFDGLVACPARRLA